MTGAMFPMSAGLFLFPRSSHVQPSMEIYTPSRKSIKMRFIGLISIKEVAKVCNNKSRKLKRLYFVQERNIVIPCCNSIREGGDLHRLICKCGSLKRVPDGQP